MVSLASLQVTPLFLCRSWGDAVLRILLSNLACVDLEKSHVGEVGLGHFGFTCTTRAKKGEHKV